MIYRDINNIVKLNDLLAHNLSKKFERSGMPGLSPFLFLI